MKKFELKNLTEYFGDFLPAGKINNRETRIAIVLLYSSLRKKNKEVLEEIEENRKNLVGDKEQEAAEYSRLLQMSMNPNLTQEERDEFKKKADSMTDCVKLDQDFSDIVQKIFNEDIDVEVKKIPLELLYDALSDCGFPNLGEDCPISVVEQQFESVIL